MKKKQQSGKVAPRRGRPVDLSKRDHILDCATGLFMARGFHATSMEDIARAARMSKLTLYRRFPDKDSLFQAVIERKCNAYLPSDMQARYHGLSPPEIIHAFAQAFFQLIMSEDALRMYRMMAAEAGQNPKLTRLFYQTGPMQVKEMLDRLLTRLQAERALKPGVMPQEARECLLALLAGSELHMKALLNIGPAPTKPAIKREAQRAARFFIASYLAP